MPASDYVTMVEVFPYTENHEAPLSKRRPRSWMLNCDRCVCGSDWVKVTGDVYVLVHRPLSESASAG